MKRKLISLCTLWVVLLSACTQPTPPPPTTPATPLTVFAAASLNDAFKEIGRAFEAAHPGAQLSFNFAGSQTLRAQLIEGAPADLFVSANLKELEAVQAAGLIDAGAPQIFVTNELIVIMPAENPAHLNTLADLARPGVKIVLAAEDVPAGSYAREMLDKLDGQLGGNFKAGVLANVVSNETNVRDVMAKVELGEADAGIVYRSDTTASPDLKTLEIPVEANVIAQYPVAALHNTAQPELARQFIEFLSSSQGRAIMLRWGFKPVEK